MSDKQINIPGYDGNCLAIIFDILNSEGFSEHTRIIMNDNIKRSEHCFQVGPGHEIIDYSELLTLPKDNFVLCSMISRTKRFLFDLYHKEWGLDTSTFASLKHGSAVISGTAYHGSGLIIEPLSVISAYGRLGFSVTVSRNSSIGHHNYLADFCTINPGVNMCGHVKVGEGSTIGPGTTVFHGVEIGRNTTIGGGSVVTRDIPDNVLAFGNPCKVIKEFEL